MHEQVSKKKRKSFIIKKVASWKDCYEVGVLKRQAGDSIATAWKYNK
jgi:hypothetical protein